MDVHAARKLLLEDRSEVCDLLIYLVFGDNNELYAHYSSDVLVVRFLGKNLHSLKLTLLELEDVVRLVDQPMESL